MDSIWIYLLIIGGWVILNGWLLPKMGVPT